MTFKPFVVIVKDKDEYTQWIVAAPSEDAAKTFVRKRFALPRKFMYAYDLTNSSNLVRLVGIFKIPTKLINNDEPYFLPYFEVLA